MRISNPTITESSYFTKLDNPSHRLYAVLLDIARHLYSLDYARGSALANIFNDIRSLLDHIDEEMDDLIEPHINALLEKTAKQNRGAYDTEVCRELSNELLQYIVEGTFDDLPVQPDEPDEWEEDEPRKNPVSARKILQKMKDENQRDRLFQQEEYEPDPEELWLARLTLKEDADLQKKDRKKRNPSESGSAAADGDISAEIIQEKTLPNNEKAVFWKTIGGKPFRISILNKKNKVIAKESFFDKGDAQVFFDTLA